MVKEIPKIQFNKNTHERKLERIKQRWNKQVNIYIGDKLTERTKALFFQYEFDDGSVTLHYKGDPYLSNIMRDIGIFDSISEAKGAGWHRKADKGFWHDIIIVKKRSHNICILKEIKKD